MLLRLLSEMWFVVGPASLVVEGGLIWRYRPKAGGVCSPPGGRRRERVPASRAHAAGFSLAAPAVALWPVVQEQGGNVPAKMAASSARSGRARMTHSPVLFLQTGMKAAMGRCSP